MQNKEIGDVRSLLSMVAKGDHYAYHKIFDFYKNRVYSYSLKYLKSGEYAQEMVQEIFLKIWMNRHKLEEVDNFGGYLRRVTVNMNLDALRKIASEQRLSQQSSTQWNESDTSTEEYIMRRDTETYINLLIEKLPRQQGLVYTMCHIQGLKQKEVAEILKISPLTVKSHLRDAVKNLKLLVGENSASILVLVFLGLIK